MDGIIHFFGSMEDPRIERTRKHNLIDIVCITLAAVLSGCDDWYEIALFGKEKEEWFRKYLELPNGIPTHDTFNRVFSALDPQELQRCFGEWIESIAQLTEGRIISVDGKRLCGGGSNGKKSIVHMVSAWCSANNMVLGQVKTDDKSNEITAIPALLGLLSIEGCTITIDAMGCQKEIAGLIHTKKANYLLAVKGNQGHLLDDIKEAFDQVAPSEILEHTTLDNDHGRVEKRRCNIITDCTWVCSNKEWPGLNCLVKITAERTIKATGATQQECRYYISSMPADAVATLQACRQHWGIENNLHWMLDVLFKEDQSQKRAGNAAANFSIMLRIALNLLKSDKTVKTSLKNKRKLAGWSTNFLQTILFAKN
jgi:predicted transposase YbfD/YdcC